MKVYLFWWSDGTSQADPEVFTTEQAAKDAAVAWARQELEWYVSDADETGSWRATTDDDQPADIWVMPRTVNGVFPPEVRIPPL